MQVIPGSYSPPNNSDGDCGTLSIKAKVLVIMMKINHHNQDTEKEMMQLEEDKDFLPKKRERETSTRLQIYPNPNNYTHQSAYGPIDNINTVVDTTRSTINVNRNSTYHYDDDARVLG